MKNILILSFFAGLFLFTSCEKDPDTNKLDNDYLVLTNYDSNTNFSSFETFYVIDSILIIDDATKPTYWKNENSQRIIEAFNDNFVSRGYVEAEKGDAADMVLQLSYINTTYYFSGSTAGPWWYNYPGYWNWGGYGWYYPFNFYYSYSTGAIIGELVDKKNVRSDKKLSIVWNTFISGLLNGNNLSYSRTMKAISQAFNQSPYLKK